MIYSRFGTRLMLVSKLQEGPERLMIHATADGTADIREYRVGDLTADEGSTEIEQAVAKLPWKVAQKKAKLIR